jgi:hypothetical protein
MNNNNDEPILILFLKATKGEDRGQEGKSLATII